MTTPPSATDTRRPGVAAKPVLLADGNLWGFAVPAARLRTEVLEKVDSFGKTSRSFELISELGYPLEIRRLIDNLRSECEGGAPDRQYSALMALAVALICRAHDIDSSQAATLLELSLEELPWFVETVLSIVTGIPRVDSSVAEKG